MFRIDFIAMIGRIPNLPGQSSMPILAYIYGRLAEKRIFLSIFVIKWPHPKVNQNIHTELKLTSPQLIPPYVFHVLGRDS